MKRLAVIVLVAACGGDDGGGTPMFDAAVSDTSTPDTTTTSTTTSVVVTMQATRTLNLAFYGVNSDDGTLHVEVNLGGLTTCPEMSSPTPDYALILGRVPAMTAASATSPGNFLDYTGDMLGGPLGAAATAVTLTNIVYTAGASVALDANLTFAAGTAVGHVYAIHCASLDS